MSHVRQQLIDAVVARVTGLTTTGARVSADRPEEYLLADGDLPALLIYDLGDQADSEGEWPTVIERRTATVIVEALAKAAAGLPSSLRTICAEVEIALGAAVTVGAQPVQLFYRGVDLATAASSDRPVMSARLRYEAILYTNAGAPEQLA